MIAKNPPQNIIDILVKLSTHKVTKEQIDNLILELKDEVYKVKFVEPLDDNFFSIKVKEKIAIKSKLFQALPTQENAKEIIDLIIELRTLEVES